MGSVVIKGGTVVTADLSYEAEVRIEGGVITEIGKGLKGDKVLDASGCYVMPGGIDPHTHLEMPFMGTYSADDFESGTRAALAGGTTMVVDFVLPGQATSYKIGMLRIQELRRRAETELGDKFDIRGFHDAVLGGGAVPLSVLETMVDQWVAQVQRG